MAHFNPAVTLGFLISGHITKVQLPYYLAAEITGALLASLFVMILIGSEASLGANEPDYSYPLPLVFGIEVFATALLMAVIYLAVYTKGLQGLGGLVIGGMVGLDIFFLAFIFGASMNPARSLAPALLSGVLSNLWLYWTATFIGSSAVALLVRRKFECQDIGVAFGRLSSHNDDDPNVPLKPNRSSNILPMCNWDTLWVKG
jgi:aquaporin Z